MKSLKNKITNEMTGMKAYHSSDIAYKEAYWNLCSLKIKMRGLPVVADSMVRHSLKIQIRKEYNIPDNRCPLNFRSFFARD